MIAKPRKSPAKIRFWVTRTMSPPPFSVSSGIWNVPSRKNRARNPNNISADPNKVKRKNLIDAYSRFGPPQTPIMKNIGSRTTSKKMKKRIRSSATNVPFIPTSRSRISARKAFGLCGSGKWFHE